jgi:vacuolar-type H+-ATPase subunit E/Vma4
MSLTTIIKKIEEETDAQCQTLIANANAEAERILAHERQEAEKEAVHIMQRAEEDLQNLKNRELATNLLRMRKEKSDNRQQILTKVFEESLHRILDVPADQYTAMFKQILLTIDEERQGDIVLSKADQSLIRQKIIDEINVKLKNQGRKLRFTLSRKTVDLKKGFIIDFKDYEMNYSGEKILLGLWNEIKGEISTQLFGE